MAGDARQHRLPAGLQHHPDVAEAHVHRGSVRHKVHAELMRLALRERVPLADGRRGAEHADFAGLEAAREQGCERKQQGEHSPCDSARCDASALADGPKRTGKRSMKGLVAQLARVTLGLIDQPSGAICGAKVPCRTRPHRAIGAKQP